MGQEVEVRERESMVVGMEKERIFLCFPNEPNPYFLERFGEFSQDWSFMLKTTWYKQRDVMAEMRGLSLQQDF